MPPGSGKPTLNHMTTWDRIAGPVFAVTLMLLGIGTAAVEVVLATHLLPERRTASSAKRP